MGFDLGSIFSPIISSIGNDEISQLFQEGMELINAFTDLNRSVANVTSDLQSKINEVDQKIQKARQYINKLRSIKNEIEAKIESGEAKLNYIKPISGFVVGLTIGILLKKIRR